MAAGAITALAGYLVPSFWLDFRLRSRQTNIRRALPDALDLITVCMQGGLSLPAALVRVSQELGTAHPLLASELAIAEREIQMGRTTGASLRQFAGRFDMEELRSLASVVSQAERFGGSITGAFRTYADSLRIKRRQRAEEMAQKAAIKLLFPTLLCIFPGIFIVILGPTAIRIYEVMVVANPWGN
jgi:tight adherence protein C